MKDDWRCVLNNMQNNMQKYTSREKTMRITIGRIVMRIDEWVLIIKVAQVIERGCPMASRADQWGLSLLPGSSVCRAQA